MATIRMTEKEAIDRGIIPRTSALEEKNKVKQEVRYIRIPVEVTRYRKGITIYHLLWAILGWLVGFMFGLKF